MNLGVYFLPQGEKEPETPDDVAALTALVAARMLILPSIDFLLEHYWTLIWPMCGDKEPWQWLWKSFDGQSVEDTMRAVGVTLERMPVQPKRSQLRRLHWKDSDGMFFVKAKAFRFSGS